MKNFYFLICLLFLNCLVRLDWDNNGKPESKLTYEHPHDGNLTKAEIKRNPNPVSSEGNGLYRIRTQDELNGDQSNNCVSKIAKCTSNCNTTYDINSSIFVWRIAIIRAKRSICYDECYNDLGYGCDYKLKRIQY